MADIKNVNLDGTLYNYKDEKARNDISDLKEDFTALPDYGYVPTAGQMMSDNVTVDTEPYSFRATPYGDREIVDGIVGGTVAFNQLLQNGNFADGTYGWYASPGVNDLSVADGVATINAKAMTDNTLIYQTNIDLIGGHKYLVPFSIKESTHSATARGYAYSAAFPGTFTGYLQTGWNDCGIIVEATSTQKTGVQVGIRDTGASAPFSYSMKNVNLFDLTQALTAPVADAVYAMEQSTAGSGVAYLKAVAPKIFAQYNPYNAGELKHVSGLSAHETVGKNFFDGSKVTTTSSSNWDVMWSDNVLTVQHKNTYSTGTPRTPVLDLLDGTYTVSFVSSIPNIDVYRNGNYSETLVNGGTFTVNGEETQIGFPNNSATTVTYTNVQIERGSAPTAYEPYQKHSYALDDSLTLMGVPKWVDGKLTFDGDIYPPSGGVQRRYGIVDLGTLEWTYNSTYGFYAFIPTIATGKTYAPLFCAKYPTAPGIGWNNTSDKEISCNSDNSKNTIQIICKDSAYTDASTFTTALSGVYCVYEKATPTTETAEPYQQIQVCPNGGTEEYISTSIVPVGHSTRYPENSRAKLDGLPWDFSTLIAPTEQEYKATQNYTTGKLLIVNNILYKVTANIANGGNIVPNTNVTATTLSDVIASL